MSNAATPPAWGAAAEVPKKFGSPSPSMSSEWKSTVVFPPSGAQKSGLLRTCPLTGVPPSDENVSIVGFGPAGDKQEFLYNALHLLLRLQRHLPGLRSWSCQ